MRRPTMASLAKDTVLDDACALLEALETPVHYKMLAAALIEGGFSIPGKEPDQVLYSRMHNDVKRHGDASRFKFMGNGVFCWNGLEGADLVETPAIRNNAKPYNAEEEVRRKKPDESLGEHELRLLRMEQPARCGNCTAVEFSGPYAVSQRRGYCTSYRLSNRAGVGVNDAPCEHWCRRTELQVKNDAKNRVDTMNGVADVIISLSKAVKR
jgi:hypothetical protein